MINAANDVLPVKENRSGKLKNGAPKTEFIKNLFFM
jgi:hypothetical protein